MYKLALSLILFIFVNNLFVQKAHAATLLEVKDTVTTSRPSASSPLSANAASGATQVSIYNNGSRYLASDSARLIRTPTAAYVIDSLSVASQSAALTTVYFPGTGLSAAGQNGVDVLTVPITAMHTVSFKNQLAIPSSGKIVITFPGSADNTASPSATTFAFNNLTSSQISYRLDGTATCSFSISAPSITCTVSGAIAANTTITFNIGCADGSSTSATCTTQSPRLINPTKTATAGTADKWLINVKTQDSSSIDIDTGKAVVGTIDSVLVQATVEPTMSFTIAGITDGAAVNTSNTTGCGQTETTNTGITSTATDVNLGVLNLAPAVDIKVGNIAAQRINITTNGQNGYSLTATSSGKLLNPETGYEIESSTTPASFPASNDWFGIHPCGLDVSASTWVEGGSGQTCSTHITGSTATECKYGWPTRTTAVTLASDSTGPITGSGGNGITSVAYASAIDGGVPAGLYRAIITYVATPTF